ncbi:MIP transporter [Diplocarpon rosae]|nr:MIP transporter [Diplocarpon rosae]
MADQQGEAESRRDEGNGADAEQAAGSPVRPTNTTQSTTPQVHPAGAESAGITPLHRAGTLPTRRQHTEVEANSADINRRRGRTISTRPKNLEPPVSSPSHIFGRSPSRRRNDHGGDGKEHGSPSLGPIPEKGQAEASGSRPRKSSVSDRSFVSPGMRRRTTTWNMAPGRQRGYTITRRPTILVNPQGMATGRDFDAQSQNFTLAGPAALPVEALVTNHPYVDAGYAELNPAYDQPVNTRPVWGLAKPLPRVIRPGMIPSRSELKVQIPEIEQQRQDAANVDLEQGQVQATLNLNMLSPQLQLARQQRENRFLETLDQAGAQSPNSPLAHQASNNLGAGPASHSIHSQVIEEEEEEDGHEKHRPRLSDLPPVPEQAPPHWYSDDAASASTAKQEEEDLSGDWVGEELPLHAYDPDTDEIHNLHTHWSVIRLRFREPLAELLAVTCQLTLAFCANLVASTSGGSSGSGDTTSWAWGLATMIGIYIAGGISGAHLNPAISIMLWIYRGFPLRKVPVYVLAQILGAFIAALISFGLFQNGIDAYGGSDLAKTNTTSSFITFPRYNYIDTSTAFFTEFTGTSILAVAVLALGDDTNAPPGAGMNAFVLGLVITVLCMAFGYNTGCALNPARDLGPRLALLAVGYGSSSAFGGNTYFIWGPWCAPIAGALFGAFLYDAAIFVGGESPVNYPRKRMARASKKWKKRMGQRYRKGYGKLTLRLGKRGRDREMKDGLKL